MPGRPATIYASTFRSFKHLSDVRRTPLKLGAELRQLLVAVGVGGEEGRLESPGVGKRGSSQAPELCTAPTTALPLATHAPRPHHQQGCFPHKPSKDAFSETCGAHETAPAGVECAWKNKCRRATNVARSQKGQTSQCVR